MIVSVVSGNSTDGTGYVYLACVFGRGVGVEIIRLCFSHKEAQTVINLYESENPL